VTTTNEWERLSISDDDLAQAKRFGNFILERSLHDTTGGVDDKLIHLAFNTALIVSYARPFTMNFDKLGKKRPSMLLPFLENLSCEEGKLHKIVCDSRDQEYAHSDSASHNVAIYKSEFFDIAISPNPFIPLPRIQVGATAETHRKITSDGFR